MYILLASIHYCTAPVHLCVCVCACVRVCVCACVCACVCEREFVQKTGNSNLHGFGLHRPSSKGVVVDLLLEDQSLTRVGKAGS